MPRSEKQLRSAICRSEVRARPGKKVRPSFFRIANALFVVGRWNILKVTWEECHGKCGKSMPTKRKPSVSAGNATPPRSGWIYQSSGESEGNAQGGEDSAPVQNALILRASDSDMPGLPKKLPGGGYPALEYLRANLARDIVQARRDLGLSQAELARRAGMLPAALNRIERGRVDPGVSTVERIDRALKAAERRASQARSAARLKR